MSTSKQYNKNILVLNGDCRNGLAIVRSLGTVACTCETTSSRSGFIQKLIARLLRSRFVKQVHFLPSLKQEKQFLSRLLSLLSSQKYDYLYCAGTEATNFAAKYKTELSQHTTPLVETYEKIWLVHEKTGCLKWADSLNVPIPKTFTISSKDELKKITSQINFPTVIKYPDSYASKGLWTYSKGGTALFDEYIRKIPEINTPDRLIELPIIQEMLDGVLLDTTAFAVNGQLIGSLSQQRLVTAWLDGGGGIVNITNKHQEILSYTKKLVHELKWTGAIEMDWIYNEEQNAYWLIEINPKFWGTTQLTISAGLDYPLWLLKHAEGEFIEPVRTYQSNLMQRWIFDEIYTVLILPKNRTRFFQEVRYFFKRFTYHPSRTDIFWNDIKPSIADFIYLLIKLLWKGKIFRQTFHLLAHK